MAAAFQILDDNLKCPICQDLLDEPKVLGCSHTFCNGCLLQLHTSQGKGDTISCAVCRQTSPLDNKDVSKLPTNQIVKAMVDSFKETASMSRQDSSTDECDSSTRLTPGQHACTVCTESGFAEAVVYCQNCADYICDLCLKQHNKFTNNANHETVVVQDIETGKVRKKHQCQTHPEEHEQYVCISCRVCICFKCRMLEHQTGDHFMIDIADFAESQQVMAEMLQGRAHDKVGSIDDFVAFVDEQDRKVTQALAKVKHDITGAFDRSVAELTRARDELLRQCLQHEERMHQELQDIAEHHQREMADILEKVHAVSSNVESFATDQLLPDDTINTQLEQVLDTALPDRTLPMSISSQAEGVTFNCFSYAQGQNELNIGELKGT